MKIVIPFLVILLCACSGKETILLPQSNRTIISKVKDHSPIYIFFKTQGNDTLAEVNRNNAIGSTNWIFNIDKRLPLRLVIPEIIKLQEKKRNAIGHKNELAENFYSYSDSVHKNLAFFAFTNVYYLEKKTSFSEVIFFDKNNKILVNNFPIKKEKLQNHIDNLPSDKPNKYMFCFDKQLSFGNYIQNKIFIQGLKFHSESLNLTNEEFVY